MSYLDDPLVIAFEAATVDPNSFDHRAHLYVAWCYLKELPLEQAVPRYVQHLQALTRTLGVPHKYHATITWAYLVVLNDLMQPDETFDALLTRHPSLLDARGALRESYDDRELFSDRARHHFILPRRVQL